jgi:hypothetical protein
VGRLQALEDYYKENSPYLEIDRRRQRSMCEQNRRAAYNFITRVFIPFLKEERVTAIDGHCFARGLSFHRCEDKQDPERAETEAAARVYPRQTRGLPGDTLKNPMLFVVSLCKFLATLRVAAKLPPIKRGTFAALPLG